MTANSATTFVVREPSNKAVNTTSDDWTVYTGIKNAPSIEADAVADDSAEQIGVYYYCKSGKMVTVMFLIPEAGVEIVDDSKNAIYLSGESVGNLIHDSNGDYYEFEAIVDGDITTVKVAEDVVVVSANGNVTWTDDATHGDNVALNGDAKKLNGIFKSYATDKYGVITKLTEYTQYTDGNSSELLQDDTTDAQTLIGQVTSNAAVKYVVGIDKVSQDYTVILGTNASSYVKNETITVADDAEIFYVDEDGNITVSSYRSISIDENDLASAVVKDYEVQMLVIQQVKDKANTYTADVKVNGAAYSASSNVTVTTSPASVDRGEDMTITVEPKEGITIDRVTVNGKRVTLDENGEYVIENVTRDPQIEITTSGSVVEYVDVNLSFVQSARVTIDGESYTSDETVSLLGGEKYEVTVTFGNSVSDVNDKIVLYKGNVLDSYGGVYEITAEDGATLTIGRITPDEAEAAESKMTEAPNYTTVNLMMTALWDSGSQTVDGISFTAPVLSWSAGNLTVNAAEAAKLTTWTNTQWGSTSVPVQITLPDGYTAENTDPNWGNVPLIWVDLKGTGTVNYTFTTAEGVDIVIPVTYS